jgi:hypothetical protein
MFAIMLTNLDDPNRTRWASLGPLTGGVLTYEHPRSMNFDQAKRTWWAAKEQLPTWKPTLMSISPSKISIPTRRPLAKATEPPPHAPQA